MCRTFGVFGAGADQGSDGGVASQLVQAMAADGHGPVVRDPQLGADLGGGHGRVCGEQGKQLLAAGRQAAERLAQRGAAFGAWGGVAELSPSC